ncbi:hypothetical protein LTR53_006049 [Teratosphaeriaceae sp. CCFEE 6253]|nr:hypothetical protein LTR53_006049 [Teratosphaeriaceae sp. CCFEE 6253]
MGLVQTVRSWSFPATPPPAYDSTTASDVLHDEVPRRHRSSRGRQRQLVGWFLTFDKQWLMVHVLAAASCFALMFASTTLFVTTTLDNFDDGHPAWLGGATGMVTLMANLGTFSALRKADAASPAQTLEQASTNNFIWTMVSILVQLFLSFLFYLLARSVPLQTGRLAIERNIATVAAIFCVITAVYDAVRLCKNRREGFDDGDDDLDEDAVSHNYGHGNAVRL